MTDVAIPDKSIVAIGRAIARLFAANPHLKATEDTATVWIEEIYLGVPDVEDVIVEAVQRHIRRERDWPNVAQVIGYCHDVRNDRRREALESGLVKCGACRDAGVVNSSASVDAYVRCWCLV